MTTLRRPNRIIVEFAIFVTLPLGAMAQSNLNLDTGTVVASGGDIVFAGSSIAPVGSAGLCNQGLMGAFWFNSAGLNVVRCGSSPNTIGQAWLTENEVFFVYTNGGNSAKVLITAASINPVTSSYANSLTLSFVTYTASGMISGSATLSVSSGNAPTISAVLNNYSNALPSAPDYGISPGSLVVIYGANLASGNSSGLQTGTLPTTLNSSSASLTVGGTTVHPAYYYAYPGQVAVVIPSSAPTGAGSLTVTNGSMTSAAFPITIVTSALGFDTIGYGMAVVTDAQTGALITPANSARPGQIVTFWGSGLGADARNTDVAPPTSFDNLDVLTGFYLGTQQVTPFYAGRSSYQGVDQINVAIPSNPSVGCAVSVVAVAGTMVSNFATIPVATSGGTCSDPLSPFDPSVAWALSAKASVNVGQMNVVKATSIEGGTTTIQDLARASFVAISGSLLVGLQNSLWPSLGSCFAYQYDPKQGGETYSGLDAGTVTATNPSGTSQTLRSLGTGEYGYSDQTGGFIPADGGSFTFTGGGGASVGAFTQSLSMGEPFTWTNSSALGTVNRAAGATINWTGGSPGTYVQISGGDGDGLNLNAAFLCDVPVSAGTFTVPPAALLALPTGAGSLDVTNSSYPVLFPAPGLDFAWATISYSTNIDTSYQ
jgi:uncharacterized protein (TIGR03437 family)